MKVRREAQDKRISNTSVTKLTVSSVSTSSETAAIAQRGTVYDGDFGTMFARTHSATPKRCK